MQQGDIARVYLAGFIGAQQFDAAGISAGRRRFTHVIAVPSGPCFSAEINGKNFLLRQ